ncbi:GMC family oxidoreductase N-terminal domain-containing protein [Streptomyces sp. NPDC046870]|uniref:GMC family oxidoreductase n=1 Tax=Streptomyces sp. NPDC046870 TaxID=3155135 RepID=UPI0034549269
MQPNHHVGRDAAVLKRYDCVVVGAGSAGCVVAGRLSEDPDRNVLLIEAGTVHCPEESRVPARWQELLGGPYDWAYRTVPQDGTNGVSHAWPRGRMLGGSSAINAMAFARGDRSVFDGWRAAGAAGWSYDDLLPYFKRGEHTVGRDPAHRGQDGPLKLAPVTARHPLSQTFHDAVLAAGHPHTEDIDGAQQYGVGWYDVNIVGGARQSAADAYVRPHLGRPNLTVVCDALVRRLLVRRDVCTGVEYEIAGQARTVRAEDEVIVCAGAIGTPQLLMLSGIGPADHLRGLGLKVVADVSGVGANLHDHVQSGIVYASQRRIEPGVNNHTELTALLRTHDSAPGPDIQLYPIHFPYSPSLTRPPAYGYTLAAAVSLPRSRGTVRLASSDIRQQPLIDPHYLEDPYDIDTLVAGLRMARRIGTTAPFARWGATEVRPCVAEDDADGWRAYARHSASTQFHPVGSCRLGTDETAAVDLELRVRGVRGLRVADASVIPAIPSMNPNATVIAIAERAASLLT